MTQRRDDSAQRRTIPPAIQAALWVLSNGNCYAPGCPFPVVFEVRPGVYKKNAQIAHIYAVKPGAARYRECRTREEERERDSFKNLILLCLAHHAAVDDKENGEELYPPELLLEWKRKHEGEHGPQLARIGPISEEFLANVLTAVFTPPVTRLERIADQLERTGSLNSEALTELRQIIAVMQDGPVGPNAQTARNLAYAADIFANLNLSNAARQLYHASDVLPSALRNLDAKLRRLGDLQ